MPEPEPNTPAAHWQFHPYKTEDGRLGLRVVVAHDRWITERTVRRGVLRDMRWLFKGLPSLTIPRPDRSYEGRSHSLWFGDVQQAGQYGWYETTFWMGAFAQPSRRTPFALDPSEDAGRALGGAVGDLAVAWPFTPLALGQLDEFIDRWIGWFADASENRMQYPGNMPERNS